MKLLMKMNNDQSTILCIDQGTSSTRIAVIDNKLNILFLEQVEHDQIHKFPGWTEHDPMQIYFNVRLLIDKLYHKNKQVFFSSLKLPAPLAKSICLNSLPLKIL